MHESYVIRGIIHMIKAENASLRISLKYRKKNVSFVRIVVTKYGDYDPFLESDVKKMFFSFYTSITVRLVSPDNSPSFGRVEVQFNGTWGTICDNNWDLKDADVVCRELGYDGALSALRDAAFGQGTGPIWLNRVQCGGSEKSVSQCAHAEWGGHRCGHYDDASVVCHQLKGKFNDMRAPILIIFILSIPWSGY